MGFYYNPTSEVPVVGRKIKAGNHTYQELKEQLQEDEHLYGLYQRNDASFMNAPHLYSENELREFSYMHDEGRVTWLGYYALKIGTHSQSNYPVE